MKVLLYKHHANDPLSFVISALTRAGYVHASILEEDPAKPPLSIIEAYYPVVRERVLDPSELASIDVFSVVGITPAQEAAVLDYARKAVAAHEKYSITNLTRFLPEVRAIIGEGSDAPSMSTPTFCSEFVVRALRDGANIALFNAPAYDIDPGHLAWTTLLAKAQPLSA
jgi:hypothetical protein